MSKERSQEYNGNGNHEWESVNDFVDAGEEITSRLRVPGGWLYTLYVYADNGDELMTTTFVPMPEVVKHKV